MQPKEDEWRERGYLEGGRDGEREGAKGGVRGQVFQEMSIFCWSTPE